MSGWMQVKSNLGYKVHAVPDSAARFGSMGRLTLGKPVCGKVKGRDAWGVSNLFVVFDGSVSDNNPKPFSSEARYACAGCVAHVEENQP